ncbi:MAG: FtsX-like permease family protein [Chloroflexi bacterium]|nr:FtsX-like permease family protein [Chloroflexota bacterium]
MKELFGIPMDAIMYALVAIFAVAVAGVGFIFFTNRTMFKMGLRNLPRRGLQTGLVVVGLMLATLITTASFTTGDTIDYSITKVAYDVLQRSDLSVNFQGEDANQASDSVYVSQNALSTLETKFADDPDIDGFLPFLQEPAPVVNQRTRLSEPSIMLSGIDPQRLGRLGGLRLVGGGAADLASLGEHDILLGKKAADELDASVGDTLTVFVNGASAQVTVAGIVKDEFAAGDRGNFDSAGNGSGAMLLSSVQTLTGHPGQVNVITVALKGDVRSSVGRSAEAAARLEPYVQGQEGRAALGVDGREIKIDAVKQDSIDEAEQFGNMFTTFFLILGLFSIAAGVMLIFMIFVMLAAERKAEMGMARAVGAQRSNLVQSFVSEGMAYNIIAGAVGAAFGVAAAIGLVIGFLRMSGGEDFEFLTAHVTARSLIISYCLGVSLTFLTVVIASMKVSAVNIVSAIRGIEEDGKRQPRRKTSWKWVAIGIPSMIVPPLGVWFLFRKGFGLAWAWILAPVGIAVGVLAILGAGGGGSGSEFLAAFGFSIIPLCLAMLAAYYRLNGRFTWTVLGAYLAAYWLLPFNIAEKVLGAELKGDIEMFPLSGVMVVIAFTLIIVFNARLLTTLFQRRTGARYAVPALTGAATVASVAVGVVLGDTGDGVGQLMYLFAGLLGLVAATAYAAVRFPHLAPALKMGVAYPLSSRFRTGMTIAMFSLIVFSIVTFSAVNANFTAMQTGQDGDGGWDVVATANRNNPVPDVPAALRDAGAPVADQIVDAGRVTTFTGEQQVRIASAKNLEWHTYPVIAAAPDFLSLSESKLEARAKGYADDGAVFNAVRTGTNLALVDSNDWGPYGMTFSPKVSDGQFEPFDVIVRNPVTDARETVTVIGVLASKLNAEVGAGVYVNETPYTRVFGAPDYQRTYIRLQDGVTPKTAAREIEAALSTQGVQADSIRKLINDSAAQDRAFTRMFQGFMALGLFVGITALGVIAFRSVVERRQQIGMLRAIGYQSGTVALTFVLESSFIALMGILSGVVGGVIVARNLFTTGQFADEGIQFVMPWTEVIAFTAVAFAFSLLMTWLPSRSAARVPVADALRYE